MAIVAAWLYFAPWSRHVAPHLAVDRHGRVRFQTVYPAAPARIRAVLNRFSVCRIMDTPVNFRSGRGPYAMT